MLSLSDNRKEYDVFLSYGKKHDTRFVRELKSELEYFSVPKSVRGMLRLTPWPKVRVFLDEHDLDADPELIERIRVAVQHSRYFLLVATPDSARSHWVQQELDWFLERFGLENVIPLPMLGKVPWCDGVGPENADSAVSLKVYELLSSRFGQPHITDFRKFRTKDGGLDCNASDYKEEMTSLVCRIRGCSRESLSKETLIAKRWTISGIAVLLALLGVLTAFGWTQRRYATGMKLEFTEQKGLWNGRIEEIEHTRKQLQAKLDNLHSRDNEIAAGVARVVSQLGMAERDDLNKLAKELDRLVEKFSSEVDMRQLPDRQVAVIRDAQATSVNAVYRINPPDILIIEVMHIVPKAPYHLRSGDVIRVDVIGTLPEAPINGAFSIYPGGRVDLGVPYGSVNVRGMTIEEAGESIKNLIEQQLREPIVSTTLYEIQGLQSVAGQHLVAPDGRITLGMYGSLDVEGMSIAEAKRAVELHLANFLEDPIVALDIFAFNSMVYHVMVEDESLGDTMTTLPITGKDRVRDALVRLGSLPPAPVVRIQNPQSLKAIEVDWQAIKQGDFQTNYRLVAGDQIVVKGNYQRSK